MSEGSDRGLHRLPETTRHTQTQCSTVTFTVLYAAQGSRNQGKLRKEAGQASSFPSFCHIKEEQDYIPSRQYPVRATQIDVFRSRAFGINLSIRTKSILMCINIILHACGSDRCPY